MEKITLVMFRSFLTGISFFSFLFLAASNPTDLTKSTRNNPDIQICTITAPADVVAETDNDGTGNCTTIVPLGTPAVSDCGGISAKAFINGFEIDPETFPFPIGSTTVTWQIQDGLDILASDEQIVEVNDNEIPIIACIDQKNRSTDTGECSYTAMGTEFDPASFSDNCPGVIITNDFNNSNSLAGAVFPKGTTTVTWTVTDATGANTASCSFDVVVTDNEIPEIACIDQKNRSTDTGECSYTAVGAEFDPASFSDNCPGVTITNDFNNSNSLAGAVFPKGITTVTWTATDATGANTTSCSFDVVVTDNEIPIIACIDQKNRSTDTGECTYTAVGTEFDPASFSDNCPGVIITNDFNNSNSLAGAVFSKGTTTVTWTVTDETGNNFKTCTFDVLVSDVENPTIIPPDDVTGAVTSNDGIGDCFSTTDIGSPVVNDNCGIISVEAYVDGAPINPSTHLFPKGTTIVIWEATDGSNNKTNVSQEVTVLDNEAPIFGNLPQVNASTSDDGKGNCSTSVMLGYPPVTDNCSAVSIKAFIGNLEIDPDLHHFPTGSTTVTWRATDGPNTIVADQVVVVKDDEAPIPNNLNAITWGCAFTVPTPVASDNCDKTINVTANRSTYFTESGSIFWTFTDGNNNSTTAEQKIVISPLSATVTSQRTSIYGKNDGKATVNTSGGVAPYTYEWRLAGNSNVISYAKEANYLGAGIYEVTVTDSNGCTVIEQTEVISAVLPEHIATSACYDVHQYIRSSTFEVDLKNVRGGIGDPDSFTYAWNFGGDATPSAATGPQEHPVTWENQGDKVVYLTIIDGSGYKQTFAINHYVGGCFEGCGETENFDMNTGNFFIGDADGNPLTGENCDIVTEKYMWIDITVNSNAYALSAEMNYAVNNGEETISRKAIGCFSEVIGYNNSGKEIYKKIPTGLFRLFQVQESGTATDMITWQCGNTFKVENINIRWTNQENMGCNQGTKPMCFGPETEVIVKTPLVINATPEDILCKGKSTGSIWVTASGGTKPYQYSITGPVNRPYQNSEFFYNLPAGEYTYKVKDADNTVTTSKIRINEPQFVVEATVEVSQLIPCYGGTGSATVTPSGGVSPYTYSWSSGATTATAENLLAEVNYTVTVTDANNCSVTKPIILTQPDQLTLANAGADASFGCGITTTTLSANTPGENEKGTWKIISGNNGIISSTDINNPQATFTGIPGESYILEWTISKTDGTCPNNDEVSIIFAEECSTLNFDGIDDYVIIGDEYNLANTNFTLEAWIRPKSVSGTKTILSKRNTGNMASGGYDLNINNGAVSFRWNGNYVSTSHKIGTDRWYHVAVKFSNGLPEIFVDGISLPITTSVSASGTPKTINHPFMIGAANFAGTPERPKNLFHGWIEEVRIWKTALSTEQLRFMMNQRVELAPDGTHVKGEILPMNVPGNLQWNSLQGYYRLIVSEIDALNGTTPDMASNKAVGYLRNIEEEQENSAPLPYISVENIPSQSDSWWDKNSWLEPTYWDPPNSTGIDGTKIDWNIAYVSDNLNSDNQDITLLGLLLKGGKLDMLGTNQTAIDQPGTGNALTLTTYLELDGFIDLNGESQLVQTEGSILAGAGRLDRDQQGTGSSFNYNYFSSPVSTLGNSQNSGYTIESVLRSGTDPTSPSVINFNYQYHYADGPLSNPLKISSYWLYKFHGEAGIYNEWQWIGQNGYLNVAEGFTMKGSSGHRGIQDLQNYIFTGMPNNGSVSVNISPGQNRLIGNPYPSAIDADEFIKDNLEDRRGNNIFNGTLYFWSHFSGQTHYLQRYIGGYATYNLAGGVKAISNDARINATGEIGGMEPKQYIPPGQAFFINTVVDENVTNWDSKLPLPVGITGGEVKFNNSQRVFQKENPAKAVFHTYQKPRVSSTSKKSVTSPEKKQDTRKRIWIKAKTPLGYHRQLLVTEDEACSFNFDLGYDAPLYDEVEEDMFWNMNGLDLVIQGVPYFNKETEIPLTLKVAENGEFNISIDQMENVPETFAIHLKDTLKSETFDLRKSSYTFDAEIGLIKNRFSIVFLNEKQRLEEKSPEELNSIEVELFYSNQKNLITILNPDLIQVENAYIYTLSGQFVKMYDYIPLLPETNLIVPLKTNGVYVLQLETVKGKKSIKFVLKN